jgi:hypothetical protein
MKFNNDWPSFVCLGDKKAAKITDSVQIVATVVHDDYYTPDDCDCYSEDEIRRWKEDEWDFIGIVLTLEVNGQEVATLNSQWVEVNGQEVATLNSLWGIERNLTADHSYFSEYANDLIDPDQIRGELEKLEASIAEAIAAIDTPASI